MAAVVLYAKVFSPGRIGGFRFGFGNRILKNLSGEDFVGKAFECVSGQSQNPVKGSIGKETHVAKLLSGFSLASQLCGHEVAIYIDTPYMSFFGGCSCWG